MLRARAANERVELHVLDDGAAHLDAALAKPFARGDPRRPGAGLGLAIVELIARSHGGSLHLGDDEGTTDVWFDVASEECPSIVPAHAER